jgi:hypothetical protein
VLPTVLTKHEFEGRDLGEHLQFTSYLALGVECGAKRNLAVAYRIQHISNAGINEPNPGLNVYMLEFSYRP